MQASDFNLKNVTIMLEGWVSPRDDGKITWTLYDISFTDLDDIDIKTTSGFLNWLLGLFHGTILQAVKDALPQIPKMFDDLVQTYNKLMLDGKQFLTDIFDPLYPCNFTTTFMPQVNTDSQIVTLNFDGRFYDVAQDTTHVDVNSNRAQRIAGLNSEQIFIHESMLASLFFALDEKFLPLSITDQNTTQLVATDRKSVV